MLERALRLLRTDFIDIGHLHSCPIDVLQRGEVSQALADCVTAGKIRVAAYSGENAELRHALTDDRFASVQCSLSLVDRANLSQLPTPKGLLVKRALAGLAWARSSRPADHCEGAYWDRWQELALPEPGLPWPEAALRWAAFQPAVSSVLVGTRSLAHLRSGIDAVASGPLAPEIRSVIDSAWSGREWAGIV